LKIGFKELLKQNLSEPRGSNSQLSVQPAEFSILYFQNLQNLRKNVPTCPAYRPCMAWFGCPWGTLWEGPSSRPYALIQIHSSVPIIMSFTFITPKTSLPSWRLVLRKVGA